MSQNSPPFETEGKAERIRLKIYHLNSFNLTSEQYMTKNTNKLPQKASNIPEQPNCHTNSSTSQYIIGTTFHSYIFFRNQIFQHC